MTKMPIAEYIVTGEVVVVAAVKDLEFPEPELDCVVRLNGSCNS